MAVEPNADELATWGDGSNSPACIAAVRKLRERTRCGLADAVNAFKIERTIADARHRVERQRLADAAPDMLEALRDLVATDTHHFCNRDRVAAVAAARAAIAKAEGRAV